jgi:hypothetical protein
MKNYDVDIFVETMYYNSYEIFYDGKVYLINSYTEFYENL